MQETLPITTILKIKCQEGFKEECLQWMLETASIASTFDGLIEKNVCVSAENEPEFLNIFTFINHESLQVWENSTERSIQAEKGKRFIKTVKRKSQLAGLEFLFPSVKPPRRWKIVVVTTCIILLYPTILVCCT